MMFACSGSEAALPSPSLSCMKRICQRLSRTCVPNNDRLEELTKREKASLNSETCSSVRESCDTREVSQLLYL